MSESTQMTVGQKRALTFREDFEQKWAPEIAKLCSRDFTPDRILAGTIAAAVLTPAIYECTGVSIYQSLLKVARWQLDVGEGVYLVPFKGVCTAVPSYTGLIALARRQKIVRHIEAYPVYEHDEFDYAYGSPGFIKHVPAPAAKRGKIGHEKGGAYLIAILPGGIERWSVMDMADIEAIRIKSQKWSPTSRPPVVECPPWYAQKTVVRHWLSKQPKSGALAEALAADEIPEGHFEPVPDDPTPATEGAQP